MKEPIYKRLGHVEATEKARKANGEPEKPRGVFDWQSGRVVAPEGHESLGRAIVDGLTAGLNSVRVEGTGPIPETMEEVLAQLGVVVNGQPALFSEAVPVDTDLHDWWMSRAASEIMPLTAKLQEYGGAGRAQDLIDIGRDLARIQGREVDDAEATELGIYFYIKGKLGRWTAAILEGRAVSDDTLHDIGIYVRMVQRTREVGGWPR